MDAANERAVNAILNPQRWDVTGKLDLHGLQVREAEVRRMPDTHSQTALLMRCRGLIA